MKRIKELSSKEWQLLSAYLDDELTTKEKQRVEKMLHDQQSAMEALEMLQHTKAVLRSMPMQRSPHNFTLTPQQAERHTISNFTVALRLSSILSGLLLLAVLILDFLPFTSMAAGQIEPTSEAEMLAMNETVEEEGEAPPIILWGAPPSVVGIYGKESGAAGPTYGLGGGAEAPVPPVYVPMPTPLPQIYESLEPSAQAEEVLPSAEKMLPEAQIEATQITEPLEGSGPILGVRSPAEQAKIEKDKEEIISKRGIRSIFSLRTIQAILAVLFVLTAIPAWLLHRK